MRDLFCYLLPFSLEEELFEELDLVLVPEEPVDPDFVLGAGLTDLRPEDLLPEFMFPLLLPPEEPERLFEMVLLVLFICVLNDCFRFRFELFELVLVFDLVLPW
jgi:hypothetical protein